MMWWYGSGMGGWGYGLMTVGNLLLWALIIFGVVTLLRHREYGTYRTAALPGDAVSLPADALEHGWEEVMQTVWENGELLRDWSFAEVRERAAAGR